MNDYIDLIARLRIPTSFGSPHLERQAADALEAQAARIVELEAAAPAQPAQNEWTDAKLRGIASDYFPNALDWPAAVLCMRHLLMEQGAAPSQPLTLSDEQIKMMAREIYHAPLAWEDWSLADVRFARAVLAAAQGEKP
jgi:hypothetical protein